MVRVSFTKDALYAILSFAELCCRKCDAIHVVPAESSDHKRNFLFLSTNFVIFHKMSRKNVSIQETQTSKTNREWLVCQDNDNDNEQIKRRLKLTLAP